MANIEQSYMDELTLQFMGKLDRDKWMKKTFNKDYISKIDFFDQMDKNDPPFFIVNYGKEYKTKKYSRFSSSSFTC